jgi:hypothetical protein
MQILHTTLPTLAAEQAMFNCLQNFGFMPTIDAADYFYRTLHANTANGYNISATLRWKKDGDTEITFISNLEKPQYDYLFAALEKAIATGEANPVAPPNP